MEARWVGLWWQHFAFSYLCCGFPLWAHITCVVFADWTALSPRSSGLMTQIGHVHLNGFCDAIFANSRGEIWKDKTVLMTRVTCCISIRKRKETHELFFTLLLSLWKSRRLEAVISWEWWFRNSVSQEAGILSASRGWEKKENSRYFSITPSWVAGKQAYILYF